MMGHKETTMTVATEEKGGGTLLRRMILVLAAAALMAAMMAVMAVPALGRPIPTQPPHHAQCKAESASHGNAPFQPVGC